MGGVTSSGEKRELPGALGGWKRQSGQERISIFKRKKKRESVMQPHLKVTEYEHAVPGKYCRLYNKIIRILCIRLSRQKNSFAPIVFVFLNICFFNEIVFTDLPVKTNGPPYFIHLLISLQIFM